MAKPNYAYAKYQRERAKNQKKEEKRLRKLGAQAAPTTEVPAQPPAVEAPSPDPQSV